MVDVLRISMPNQLKSLLTESCSSSDLYIHYKRLEDSEWTSHKVKSSLKSHEDISGIDPCESYEIRLAPGGPESTFDFQKVLSIGPYYETLNESYFNNIELEDNKFYEDTSFPFTLSSHNESFVTLEFGQVCAMKMKVYYKKYETNEVSYIKIGEFTSDSRVSKH